MRGLSTVPRKEGPESSKNPLWRGRVPTSHRRTPRHGRRNHPSFTPAGPAQWRPEKSRPKILNAWSGRTWSKHSPRNPDRCIHRIAPLKHPVRGRGEPRKVRRSFGGRGPSNRPYMQSYIWPTAPSLFGHRPPTSRSPDRIERHSGRPASRPDRSRRLMGQGGSLARGSPCRHRRRRRGLARFPPLMCGERY